MNQGERILGIEAAVTRLLESSDNHRQEIKWLRGEIARLDTARLGDAHREIEGLQKALERRSDRRSSLLLGLVGIVAAVIGAIVPIIFDAIRHRVGS